MTKSQRGKLFRVIREIRGSNRRMGMNPVRHFGLNGKFLMMKFRNYYDSRLEVLKGGLTG